MILEKEKKGRIMIVYNLPEIASNNQVDKEEEMKVFNAIVK